MARRTKRNRPSSPAEILARNALQRGAKAAQARKANRNPQLWGIPDGIDLLPANEDLSITRDPNRKSRILRARRSDVFALVTLSADQERAAGRYVKDWLQRAGVKVAAGDHLQMVVVDSSPGLAPGQNISQGMIDAGRRIERAHRAMGRAGANLLEALVEPMAMRGEIRVWRVTVERITGETERHAQAARVRQACEDLHLGYQAIDKEDKAEREARGRAPFAGGGQAG